MATANGFESNVEILSGGTVQSTQVVVGGELMLGVVSITVAPLEGGGGALTVTTIKVVGASLGRRSKKIETEG